MADICRLLSGKLRKPAPWRTSDWCRNRYLRQADIDLNAFEAASKDGKAEQLENELTQLFEDHNRGSSDRTEIPATFLKVTVTKP